MGLLIMKRMSHTERYHRRKLIAGMVREGNSIKRVAQEIGVSYITAHNACLEFAVDVKEQSIRMQNKKRNQAIAENVRVGRDVRDIINEYNVSLNIIKTSCKENNVILPRMKIADNADTTVKIVAGLMKGDKYREIADEAGFSTQYIESINKKCKVHGLDVPERSRSQ